MNTPLITACAVFSIVLTSNAQIIFDFSDTSDERITLDGAVFSSANSSDKYIGASGGNNIRLNSPGSSFSLMNLDVSGVTDSVDIYFGGFERFNGPEGLDSSLLRLDYKLDSQSPWSQIDFGAGSTNSWNSTLLSTSNSISLLGASTLSLRFSYVPSSGSSIIRIDDVSILSGSAIPEPGTSAAILGGLLFVAVVIRRKVGKTTSLHR